MELNLIDLRAMYGDVQDVEETPPHHILSHITMLLAALEAAQADAARYHWLRGEGREIAEFWRMAARNTDLTLDNLDRAIDAARSTTKEPKT